MIEQDSLKINIDKTTINVPIIKKECTETCVLRNKQACPSNDRNIYGVDCSTVFNWDQLESSGRSARDWSLDVDKTNIGNLKVLIKILLKKAAIIKKIKLRREQ